MDLQELVHEIAVKARAASERTAELSSAEKDAWLLRAAQRLEAARDRIRAANALDVAEAREKGIAAPLAGRLELSDAKWRDMITGLRDVAALPDPVGRVEQTSVRPNGLEVGRMRIPLGVIGMIYESRPNVTVDAAALCV
jgi:glutamate-5-semialdehyde dehydrogenase